MTAPDPTAGECDMGCQPDWHHDDCAIYLPKPTPASPPAVAASTGTSEDAEALARLLAAAYHVGGSPSGVDHRVAAAVLASDWLAAREAAARAEAWEEGYLRAQRDDLDEVSDPSPNPYRAARIAQEVRP